MAPKYITRSIEQILKRVVAQFPAVILTGPRQCGKTTVLRHLFEKDYRYVSLEPPDSRAAAAADPRGFLDYHAGPVIFDEVQYAPELLFYIKERIDENREVNGQYILTGSQNLLLMEQVSETLAGRAAILKLLPLSRAEMMGEPDLAFPWSRSDKSKRTFPVRTFWKFAVRGSYPKLVDDPGIDEHVWHQSYIQTYLERDLRTLRQVGDLTQFQIFLRSLATRSGQLLQLSSIAREVGITVNTVKAWIAILEASYQVVIVRPYFANVHKRLVKTPKIYFTDLGTLSYLTGLQDLEHAASGPLAGQLVETAVFSELLKRYWGQGIEPQIYFWRTSTGEEVDFVVIERGGVIPIEVKSTSTPKPNMAKGIFRLQKDLGDPVQKGYLVHLGNIETFLGSGVETCPFAQL